MPQPISSTQQQQQHPMLPVPDAIRTVLYETARILHSTTTTNEALTEEIPVTAESTTMLSPNNPLVGRTLAEDVIQREPGYPPYRASIMDGYAISTQTKVTMTGNKQQWTHTIVDKVYAGDTPSSGTAAAAATATTTTTTTSSTLPPAHYVTTGAIVPDAYDCVVPVEQCVVDHTNNLLSIQSDAKISSNTWIRQPACDIPAGSVVLPAGHVLNGISLALLLQAGATRVVVKKKVTVGVLSTGNELEQQQEDAKDDAWEARKHGNIPDANRPILLHLLASWGYCKVVDLGIVRDTSKKDLATCLQKAAQKCHVIVTTGGISMGETDIVEEVLLQRLGGRLHFGRLHMKPGKPTTVMTLPRDRLELRTDRMIFCLPGNPVSAAVCAQLLLRPCLHLWFHGPSDLTHGNSFGPIEEQLQQMVEHAWVPSELQATLANDVKLDKERPEYLRVTLEYQPVGAATQYLATSTGVQRSSRLMSMRDARGLMVLPQGTDAMPVAKRGETYTVLWLGSDGGEASVWLPSVQVRTSRHMAKQTNSTFSVGLVLLTPKKDGKYGQILENLSERINAALSGSKSGSVFTASAQVYDGPVNDKLCNHLSGLQVDFCILVTMPASSSFYYHTQVSNFLRSKLAKVADSMALQVRKGAASVAPQAAMYETLVGYLPSLSPADGSVVVLLSELGLDGALGNVRGLIKHALQIARGTGVQH